MVEPGNKHAMNISGRRFYLTDVFGRSKYSGNQLATFIDCENLTAVEMQQIAREINFSETTFVQFDAGNPERFDVRIFTPVAEVPFAGHPVLGTAWVIREKILRSSVETLTLNLAVGAIKIRFVDDLDQTQSLIWMNQVAATFGQNIGAINSAKYSEIAATLGLGPADIDPKFPILEVSTGFPHWIVPLRDLTALQKIRVDRNAELAWVESAWAKNILVFAPTTERPGQALAVRVFAGYFDIAEDAATGSGNGALAAYLAHTRYFGEATVDITVGQGYEMGRPSELHLRGLTLDQQISVEVGGHVVGVAEGFWSCC
jgi:trans-2,3-dihydro-3-hydroxyanthranilate isomerase